MDYSQEMSQKEILISRAENHKGSLRKVMIWSAVTAIVIEILLVGIVLWIRATDPLILTFNKLENMLTTQPSGLDD